MFRSKVYDCGNTVKRTRRIWIIFDHIHSLKTYTMLVFLMYEYCNCRWSHSTMTMRTVQNASKTTIPCSVWYWGESSLHIRIWPTQTSFKDYSMALVQPKEDPKKKFKKNGKILSLKRGTTGYDKRCRNGSGGLKCVVPVLNVSIWKYARLRNVSATGALACYTTAPGEIEGARRLKTTPWNVEMNVPFTISSLRPVDATSRYVLKPCTDVVIEMRSLPFR